MPPSITWSFIFRPVDVPATPSAPRRSRWTLAAALLALTSCLVVLARASAEVVSLEASLYESSTYAIQVTEKRKQARMTYVQILELPLLTSGRADAQVALRRSISRMAAAPLPAPNAHPAADAEVRTQFVTALLDWAALVEGDIATAPEPLRLRATCAAIDRTSAALLTHLASSDNAVHARLRRLHVHQGACFLLLLCAVVSFVAWSMHRLRRSAMALQLANASLGLLAQERA